MRNLQIMDSNPKESPKSSGESVTSVHSNQSHASRVRPAKSHRSSASKVSGDRNSGDRRSSEDLDPETMDFTEDGDVIERIRSRASVSSDYKHLQVLREKYREGFYRLDKHDPRDPHNWSLPTRIAHQFFFGVALLLAYSSASIFAPLIWADTNHGVEVGMLSFSIFLIGNAVGPLIYSPLCSMFGRLVSIYAPLVVSGLFMCICANLEYTSALVVYRFLAGILASGPMCSLRGASADIWLTDLAKGRAHEIAIIWSNFSLVLGSCGAPVFGALLVQTGSYGWRWACWLAGLLSVAVGFCCMMGLRETYLPVIEQKAGRDERLDSGFWGLHSEHDSYNFELPSFSKESFQVLKVAFHPIAFSTMVFTAYNYGILFLLVAGAPEQIRKVHPQMSFRASFATLLAVPIGFLVTCWFNIVMARPRRAREWYTRMHHSSSGISSVALKPETQLWGLVGLGWLLPGGLFMFGWSLYHNVHWIVPVVGMGVVGSGLSVNMRGCHFYIHDAYPGYFQLTSSICIIIEAIFSGVFPLFARQVFNTLNVHWGSSLMAFIAIVLYLIMCLLAFAGHRFREYDDAATHTS